MLVVKIDDVDAQPLQRPFACLPGVLRLAVDAEPLAVRGALIAELINDER
jgi:hypothetical protein